MRTKRLLAATFVLAVIVLASPAAGASGQPRDATPATPPRHVFTLFHETWCVGDVGPDTPCDVTIGAGSIHRSGTHAAIAPGPSPLDRLRAAVHSGSSKLVLTPLDKALRLEELLRAAPPPARP